MAVTSLVLAEGEHRVQTPENLAPIQVCGALCGGLACVWCASEFVTRRFCGSALAMRVPFAC